MKMNEVTFLNPDREYAALKVREHLTQLLDAEPKDYDAIKTIYSLVLKEEDQHDDRRRTDIAERELDHKIAMDQNEAAVDAARVNDAKKPKILPVSEIKHRVRVLLGKECPR